MDLVLAKKFQNLKDMLGNKFKLEDFSIMAGPCAVESEKQIFDSANFLSGLGIKILRGGCYKPRTSPYSFQGMEEEGLKLIRRAADEFSMAVITEALNLETLLIVSENADIIQVGARNMYNYPLLKAIGKLDKPVLLKRAFSATYDEWLFAAEYIIKEGNEKVILCERGIRTFENTFRNTLDISAVPYVKATSNLPIIVDPSHACGMSEFVKPLALAGVASGADGLMIEVHPEPEKALSDGRQSLNFKEFEELYNSVKLMRQVIN